MAGFGCVNWINKESTIFFTIISITLRLIAGIGSSLIHVSVYAMAQIKWPDEVQQKIGILEAASGAGIFIGPVFGSVIFSLIDGD